MVINVVGKAHRQGTSKKTGNPYDFIQVYYNGPAYGVIGLASEVVNLDPTVVNFDSIEVGCRYDAQFDQRGYCLSFEKVER